MKIIGIIGLGRWGNNIFNSLIKNKNIKKIIVTSIPLLKYQGDIEIEHVPYIDNEDNFLKKINAVIVATSPLHHEDILYKCKNYKIPALFEKPITASTNSLKTMIKDTYFNNYIDVDYIYLYSSLWKTYLNNIKFRNSDQIYIQFWSGNNGPIRKDVNIFWDWLPHDFSMLFSITNYWDFEIEKISLIKDKKGIYYRINLHKKNIKVEINVGNKMKHKMRSCNFITENGNIKFDDVAGEIYVNNVNKIVQSGTDLLKPLDNILNNFINKLKKDTFYPDKKLLFSLKINTMIDKISTHWTNRIN